MNLFTISWANIIRKPLNTTLSLMLLAFGVGLISLMLVMENQLQDQFDRNIKDIDMVLGAKGSPLQMILSAVYQVDAPTGNINMKEAQRVMKHPYIADAIPLAYGDNYEKYRIVGAPHKYAEHYNVQLAEGKLYERPFDAVLGAGVAKESGLKIGDTFYSAHGLEDATDVHTNREFHVVGIYSESQSVVDHLILTPIQSIWDVHTEEGDSIPDDEKEYTAVLLKKKNPLAMVTIPNTIKDTNMTIALPAIEINRLNENFGLGMQALGVIALIIVVISFVSVFISLFNSLKERKYELALIRTMGGSRLKVFVLILQEGMILSLLGFIIGFVFSRIGLIIMSHQMEENFHYTLNDMGPIPMEWLMLLITIFVGSLASLLPAVEAVNIDISKTLADG
ncbi:MAG: ABC transporter permease [Flavobacteriales bacterium]|nr:ABC transporter permease [Flavobacteriales bacterium]